LCEVPVGLPQGAFCFAPVNLKLANLRTMNRSAQPTHRADPSEGSEFTYNQRNVVLAELDLFALRSVRLWVLLVGLGGLLSLVLGILLLSISLGLVLLGQGRLEQGPLSL